MKLCLLLFLFALSAYSVGAETMASAGYVRSNLGTKHQYYPGPSDRTPPPPTCRLAHLQYIARHGTRYPTSGDLERQESIQDSINDFTASGGKFNAPYQWLATWKYPYTYGEAGLLVTKGEEEHYQTAKRMLQDYSPLLNLSYNPERYDIQETQVSRTGVSASSFAHGIFEDKGTLNGYTPLYIWSREKNSDRVLRFFDDCPYFTTSVLNNATAYAQQLLFEETLQLNAINLSMRLGTYPLWQLSVADYLNFWSVCRGEASLYDNYSQFCSIWTEQDIDDIAFREDLEFYWKRGYGHDLNYNIAVDLMSEVVSDIQNALLKVEMFYDHCTPETKQHLATKTAQAIRRKREKDGEESPLSEEEEIALHLKRSAQKGEDCKDIAKNIPYQLTASLRFAHAETLVPLVAWLSLYETDPTLMQWDTPPAVRANRAWKTTQMSPYASNINIVVYVCEGGAPQAEGEGPVALVKVLHNEEEVVISGCGGGVYCPLNDFLTIFAHKLSLDFDDLCSPSTK